jgi:hypothetical protein
MLGQDPLIGMHEVNPSFSAELILIKTYST